MNNAHIVVVEDEPALAGLIQDYLISADMTCDLIEDGALAVNHIFNVDPDLVVLDLMLPGKDGLSICRELRNKSNVPIIMQTAKVEEIDRLLGLEMGADDYICKPYSPRELVARIKAVLRRSNPIDETNHEVGQSHGLQIDEEKWSAKINMTPLELTRREFRILAVLYNRPGRVFSRSQLLDMAFPDDSEIFDRTIDSHIKNLRRKIKKLSPDHDPIRSVYGVGYSYES